MERNIRRLVSSEDLPDEEVGSRKLGDDTLASYQKQFNYSAEELDPAIRVSGEGGQEAVGSMGDDTPFAVLFSQPRIIYDYFRQQSAQVTNPPIGPLRKAHVMSFATNIGREMNVFCEAEGQMHRLNFRSLILLYSDFKQSTTMKEDHYHADTLDITLDITKTTLEATVKELYDKAEKMIRSGTVLLVLFDRSIARDHLPVPAPMAVGAIQARLVRQGLRHDTNIIVETASARDPRHFVILLGFGATAVYPYLTYETLGRLVDTHAIAKDCRIVILNYRNGINKGLYKIMSKMGISTIAPYRCLKLFGAVGLRDDVVGLCFQDAVSYVGGANSEDFQQDLPNPSRRVWLARKPISQGSLLKYVHGGGYHAYDPDVVRTLQQAVQSGGCNDYQGYAKLVNERPITMLRDLLTITPGESAVNIADVEPADELFECSDTAAMSIGALSPETHEVLTETMSSIGGNSNSDEGGEDPAHYGANRVSRTKQAASDCFGVAPAYLVNADVIQIKVTQGTKPGEGGQLSGDKATPYITKLRYSVPGVVLIFPPPYRDIYSVKDLAQLILDLEQVNPKVVVSVKLASEPGVDTIATGVAKAYADLITIAGYGDGTGASPLSSMECAGYPWELGLVEIQQVLVVNGLCHEIRLQVDDGLKTSVDIIKAAILGTENFGFGTGPMVTLDCKHLRICHLNNCVTDVATQDDKLCKNHYHGLLFKVTSYFEFVARETHRLMVQLGVTCPMDLIGHTDLLEEPDGFTAKQQKLALSKLLETAEPHPGKALYYIKNDPSFDNGLLSTQLLQQVKPLADECQSKTFWSDIHNTDRSVGTPLSGYTVQTHDDQELAADPVKAYFNGAAGQSLGTWSADDVELYLTGNANGYVGKGMIGGLIAIRPLVGSVFRSHKTSIIGNTCLYGTAGGHLYTAGHAGERFDVHNSGAITVVEDIGDNGCEYMTGDIVCILGKTGVNLDMGTTGDFVCVLGESSDSRKRVSLELIEVLSVDDLAIHEGYLRGPTTEYVQHTGSQHGEEILTNWLAFATKFALVKLKSDGIKALLGHRSRSTAESHVQVQ